MPVSPLGDARRRLNSIEGCSKREGWNAEVTIDAVDTVLRKFLQRHWRRIDSEMTSRELVWAAEWHWRLDESLRVNLQSLLQAADRIKFGQFQATPEMADRVLKLTRALIESAASPSHVSETRLKGSCRV
jgi:hypothetical protein